MLRLRPYNKNDAEIRIENLQNLIDVIKEAKENGIERDGYKFTYDKEQTTFTCEKEDGSKLTKAQDLQIEILSEDEFLKKL